MLFLKEEQKNIKVYNNEKIKINIIIYIIKIGLLLIFIFTLCLLLIDNKFLLYKKEINFYKKYIFDCKKKKRYSLKKKIKLIIHIIQ